MRPPLPRLILRHALLIGVIFAAPGAAYSGSPSAPPQGSFNQKVFEAIKQMPLGGSYAVNRAATSALSTAIRLLDGELILKPELAQPSYCSGATYLVFLRAIAPSLERIPADEQRAELLKQLLVSGQPDGIGIWGRWNANGPGTAKLFHDTGLGRSFWNYEEPPLRGDFLKLWWKDAIGRDEFGHSVIFLDYQISAEGEKGLLVWSSNKPDGYGEKFIPFVKIHHALFSRCEHPERIGELSKLESRDSFLAEMLHKNFPLSEVKSRLVPPPHPRTSR